MVACAAVPMPDPARDVLGVVRLNEERIERKVLADRRSVRRGAYQRYARWNPGGRGCPEGSVTGVPGTYVFTRLCKKEAPPRQAGQRKRGYYRPISTSTPGRRSLSLNSTLGSQQRNGMAYLREGIPIDAWLGSRLGFALDSVLLLEAIITGKPAHHPVLRPLL
jgi:hypothetical protein